MQTQLQRRRKDPAETRCKIALLILFLLGAALIALAGTEPQLDLMQLADRAVQVSGVIHPQKEYTRRYEELFSIYQSCYRAVHQINEQLSAFLGS